MCSTDTIAYGLAGLFVGLPLAYWPYTLARWDEIIDAIGRKSAGRVEPADWKVMLNRYGGAAAAIVGALILLLCFLR